MKWRNPHRLLLTQSLAVRMKVPLQGHCPNGQAQASWHRVAVAGGIQQPIQMIEQAIHSVRGARRLRAIVGRCDFGPSATKLLKHSGAGGTALFRAALLQASPALSEFA